MDENNYLIVLLLVFIAFDTCSISTNLDSIDSTLEGIYSKLDDCKEREANGNP